MKPDFALNLSHTGIGILHRGKDGWHLVGEVRLDEKEFADKLAYLRQTAALLDGGSITTKLLIPNSQILYTMVEAPGPTEAQRHSQIRKALEGATPYAVDEVAYDWCEIDGKVRVAAVASETLREAEEFAVEHGFQPLSFVAIPEAGKFLGEPYFGATVASETILEGADTVERDDEAILIPGGFAEAAENVAKAKPDAPAKDSSKPAAEAAAQTAKTNSADKTEKTHPGDGGEAETAAPDTAKGADKSKSADQKRSAAPKSAKGKGKAEDDAPAVGADLPKPAKKKPAKKPKKPKQEVVKTLPPSLSFSSRRTANDKTPDKPTGKSERKEPGLKPAPGGKKSAQPKADKPAPKGAPPPGQPVPTTSGVAPALSALPPAHSEAEEQALTVFGARKQAVMAGKPRHLAVALISTLVVLLGGVALWSTYDGDKHSAEHQPVAGGDVTAPVARADTEGSAPTVSQALALLSEPTRQQGAPPGAEPETEVAADSDITAAPLPDSPPDRALVMPDGGRDSGPDTAALSTSEADLHLDAEIQPEPEPEPVQITIASAEAAYAKTGVWQLAPNRPDLPGMGNLDALYIASIDPVISSQDAVALPALPANSQGFALPQQNSPLPSDTRYQLDARGFVIPTAEGALTPDGALVFAGAPPVRPKLRGNRVPQVALTPDQGQPGQRPPTRPADLVARNEAAQLGGLSRRELGAIRPKPRLKPAKALDEANEAPTAQAVTRSLRPRHRPQNFAQMVAQVRARMAAEESRVGAAAVPQPQILTPGNPTNASVARLATVKNAINLRRISLIGVYGTASKRRALVRLPNGRYIKVQVGERMHGGKVAAIGESELRYVKGGRTIVLRMPKS